MISKRELGSSSAAMDYYYGHGHGEQTRRDANRSDGAIAYYFNDRDHSDSARLEWGGKAAEFAGFDGEVQREHLKEALDGRLLNPETHRDQQLGRYVPQFDDNGEMILRPNGRPDTEIEHRPGLDLTFTPPKSFSIAWGVGGDERIMNDVHVPAVRETMDWLEARVAQTRVTADNKTTIESTGNLLYATTNHEVNRNNDPNVHTHVLVLNATWSERKEKWMSFSNEKLYQLRAEADAIYKDKLAEKAQAIGYVIEKGKHGPELKGFSEQDRNVFSRKGQIERHREATVPTDRSEKVQMLARQKSVLATRAPKVTVPREKLEATWKAVAHVHGIDAERVVGQARQRSAERGKDAERDDERQRQAVVRER